MIHAEWLVLIVALLAMSWRQRSRRGARPWLAPAALLLLGGLVFAREPLVVPLVVRMMLAAAIAGAVTAPRAAQAAIAGAVVALGWPAPEGVAFGQWPLAIAAALLAFGLPTPRSTAPPSTHSGASSAV